MMSNDWPSFRSHPLHSTSIESETRSRSDPRMRIPLRCLAESQQNNNSFNEEPSYFDANRALLTEESLENTLRLLNENFNLLGFQSVFTVSNSTLHLDVASLVNGAHEMTTLYQQSLRDRENLELKLKRAEADIEHLQRAQRRLQNGLDETDRALNQSREQERQLGNKVKALTLSHKTNRDEVRRLKADLGHAQAQYKHERNRLEREGASLRERLHSSMTTQRNVPHMDMLNSLQNLDGKRRTWARPKGGGLYGEKSKDELHQVTLKQMEARQEETLLENKDLRRCLFRMQRRLDSLLRNEPSGQPRLSDDMEDDLGSEEENEWPEESGEAGSGLESAALFQLPFDLLRDDLERGLCDRLKQLRTRMTAKSPAAAEEGTPKEQEEENVRRRDTPAMRLAWEEVEQLKRQVAQYEHVIESQEALLKRSLLDSIRRPSRDKEREVLEEQQRLADERRALFEEKASFDRERQNFSDARKALDEDRATFLRQQLTLLSPASRGRLLPSPRRNSIAVPTLTPSRSSFTPAPSSRGHLESLRFPTGSGSSNPSSLLDETSMSP